MIPTGEIHSILATVTPHSDMVSVMVTVDSLIMAITHSIWILSIVMVGIMATITAAITEVITEAMVVMDLIIHHIIVPLVIITEAVSAMKGNTQFLMAEEIDQAAYLQTGTIMSQQAALQEEILTCQQTEVLILQDGGPLQLLSKYHLMQEGLSLQEVPNRQLTLAVELQVRQILQKEMYRQMCRHRIMR